MTSGRLHGEVVYLYAFDIAYEMRREPVSTLLGQPVVPYAVDTGKRNPKQLSFYRPQMARLPPVERRGPHGVVRIERTIKLLPVGALSVTVRVPFAVDRFEDLIAYHDLMIGDRSLTEEVRALVEEARQELRPMLISPNAELGDEEAYTIFVLANPPTGEGGHFRSEPWLREQRRAIAALLTQEDDPVHLSDQEVEESTARYLTYYDHDLVVVDWDAALVIESPESSEQSLFIMELANVQLAELEAYDHILDQAVDRTYRDVMTPAWFTVRRSLHDLRELRIDLSRLSDELENISKFFGDWHLARLYAAISDRFHLRDWHRSIDGKLRTIDEMYQLAKQDVHGRWMLVLEVSIVLLFVVDIAFIFTGK
ncbi:MAG: hypothetical protein H0W72_02685 [Planctomycetes bacterium]|nr:hypothetical protein [Planctomycetota bacterium]